MTIPEPVIRKGVAFALSGTSLPAAVPVLLKLMEDPLSRNARLGDDDAGRRACFDSAEIRAALLGRATKDDDDLTSGEALCGLGRRGDGRGVPLLVAELEQTDEQCTPVVDGAKVCLGIDEIEDVASEELLDDLRAGRH